MKLIKEQAQAYWYAHGDAESQLFREELERKRRVLAYLEKTFAAGGKDVAMILKDDGNTVKVTDMATYKHVLVNVTGDSSAAMIVDICKQARELLLT